MLEHKDIESELTHEIELSSPEEAIKLFGRNGELRKRIQSETGARIVDRGAKVVILGSEPDTRVVGEVLDEMLQAVRRGHTPSMGDVVYALDEARTRGAADLGAVLAQEPGALRREMHIKPRTRGQGEYLDALESHEITMVIGPAGTGKTYLAMAAAVSALLNKQVGRLILTRPAVEAGENLGFLPGDLKEKVNPYLRPLYDALHSMVDSDRVYRFLQRETIEVAPLAFMRGRTLDHAFAILDEAQNTTTEQMLMFLTRLGTGSRAVVTGDITQIDLPKGVKSGLVEASRILRNTPGIAIIHLSKRDVVRHPLVQRIVDAYEAESRGLHSGRSESETAHLDAATGNRS
ncbi:MAG TPA: PhoH family protein [Candidatus Hydrogenedentes bacterium]|nr:PhoH family protein [Candidatus Hydrogenedentota bacterium]HOT51237.1 PhoH family protein [Candidatus Hydrogenedentota bacterium]HOV73844.1 PhoH family protein [Candidatus Hydrogenedentota bacterium]HPC14933.1 PhoH family protein [Candidatus Hydrogenedentota bacterium]HRT18797.1 PhoH family protein [Candidatus Hydrogenedentota bacterium]